MRWFVRPETVRLDLPGGEWLEVKRVLSIGEKHASFGKVVREMRKDGSYAPDFERLAKAEVLSYLVAWSLRDDEGRPVRIDTEAQLLAALNNLSEDGFAVISEAIGAHVKAMDAARDAEKNATGGERASSTISPSAV